MVPAVLAERIAYARQRASQSKTGDPACSVAASHWARKTATSEDYKTLAICRAKARGLKQAGRLRDAGQEAKAQHVEHRLKTGQPLTAKDRLDKAKELVKGRAESFKAQAVAVEKAKRAAEVEERIRKGHEEAEKREKAERELKEAAEKAEKEKSEKEVKPSKTVAGFHAPTPLIRKALSDQVEEGRKFAEENPGWVTDNQTKAAKKLKEVLAKQAEFEAELAAARENGLKGFDLDLIEKKVKQGSWEVRHATADRDAQGRPYGKVREEIPHLIPYGPIRERLEKYVIGDAKVKDTIKMAAAFEEENGRPDSEYGKIKAREMDLGKQVKAMVDPLFQLEYKIRRETRVKAKAKLSAEYNEMNAKFEEMKVQRTGLREQLTKHEESQKAKLLEMLGAHDPTPIKRVGPTEKDYNLEGFEIPGGKVADEIDSGIGFVSKLLARMGADAELEPLVLVKEGVRASHSGFSNRIEFSTKNDAEVMAHELGHMIEHRVRTTGQRVGKLANEFLDHRVGDEVPIDMHKKFNQGDPGEMGRKDKFDRLFMDEYNAYYTGKQYGSDTTEIMSMGLQVLHKDPAGFARLDPEYFKFVVGILDGSLR